MQIGSVSKINSTNSDSPTKMEVTKRLTRKALEEEYEYYDEDEDGGD